MSTENIVQEISKEDFIAGMKNIGNKAVCIIDEAHGCLLEGVNVYPGMYEGLGQDFAKLPLDAFMQQLEETASMIEAESPRVIVESKYYAISETDFNLVSLDNELKTITNKLLTEQFGEGAELGLLMALFVSTDHEVATKSYGIIHVVEPIDE